MKLQKREKILLILYRLSKGVKKNLKFEDIAVSLFKKYPEEFHLKGYKEYPDSDLIRRPLYKFRDDGLLAARNMIFSFTDKGLGIAELLNKKVGKKKINSKEVLERYLEKEIRRVIRTNGFRLFAEGKEDQILDTDFFEYLGISVRSDKKEFKNRLNVLSELAKEASQSEHEGYRLLSGLHAFMIKNFRGVIGFFKE